MSRLVYNLIRGVVMKLIENKTTWIARGGGFFEYFLQSPGNATVSQIRSTHCCGTQTQRINFTESVFRDFQE